MSEQITAAVIGLGVGERHISGYVSDSRCNLVAICDLDEEKLTKVGSKYPDVRQCINADEILQDPSIDVVSIASYDNFHAIQVLAAIEAGKHIFVEKPLCLTNSEYHQIDTLLSSKPRVHLSSNLVLRRAPQFHQLKLKIDKGVLGDIYYMEGDYNYGRLHKITKGWRGKIPFYSVSHGGAIHMIDLLLWLTGKIVTSVIALGNNCVTRESLFKFPSQVTSLLKFSDGSTAKVSVNFPSVCPHHHGLNIFGNKGSFIHTHQGGCYYNSRDPISTIEKINLPYKSEEKGAVQKSFITQILDGEKADVAKEDVFRSMAVSLAIENSLNSGNWEEVKYGKIANIQI
jgi:predicted dehydrogenase